MKTAEEVAEEILSKREAWETGHFYVRGSEGFKTYLAQALTAYAEERVKEAMTDSELLPPSFQPYIKQARAEALEEAANCLIFKSGEDRLTFDPVCIEELKRQPEVAMRKLLAGFAEEIRALKAGGSLPPPKDKP